MRNLRCYPRLNKKKTMPDITLYSRSFCGWCDEAKEYLRSKRLEFREVDISRDPAARAEMEKLSGQSYVPTIVVDGRVLANFDVGQLQKFLTANESASR
jgi:glutaredoxin